MNCDDAFEYMTDVTKQDTGDLQWHLDMCPRCRRMKETLEPALSLLTMDPPEMPSSQEPVPPMSRVDELLGAQAIRRRQAEPKIEPADVPYPMQSSGFRRVAAVGVAALTILAGVLLMSSPGQSSGANSADSLGDICMWKQRGIETDTASPMAVVTSCLDCHQESHDAGAADLH